MAPNPYNKFNHFHPGIWTNKQQTWDVARNNLLNIRDFLILNGFFPGWMHYSTIGIYTGTSTTSNSIGTGNKTFTTQTSLSYAVGVDVTVTTTTPDILGNTMYGKVSSYTPSTGVLVVNVSSVVGTGRRRHGRAGLLIFTKRHDSNTPHHPRA